MYRACVALLLFLACCAPVQAQSASDLIGKVFGLPGERQSSRRVFLSELDPQQTMRLQKALSALGYLNGHIDGEAGPGTWDAVATWARDRGWKPPSTLRAAHLEALEAEASSVEEAPSGTSSPATAKDGSLISRVQSGLAQLGYLKTTPSGILDQETRQAVSDWAHERGWAAPETIREAHAEFIEKEIGERQAGAVSGSSNKAPDPVLTAEMDSFSRLADEIAPEPELTAFWQEQQNFDRPGGDIRHGLMDAALSGISQADCASACLATKDCNTYTFNRNGNVCFLKGGGGELVPFNGAVTAVLAGQTLKLMPPPTRGPLPVSSSDVSWQDTSSLAEYQEGLRERARSLGASCQAEEASLEKLSDDMTWQLDRPAAIAGQPVSLTWKGNTLKERIPVWLVVSSPDKVRFAGRGHIALGPDAPNPFGIKAGAGKTRSLVSLASRGAGVSGKIDIIPLEAGKANVTIELVAYLRSCNREVTLKSDASKLEITPAPAEIVLNTVEGRASLAHQIAVKKFSRTIFLNQHRFLLLDADTGSEIVERAGSKLQVSPTHRFIAVEQGGRIEIVDLVDGRTATHVDLGELFWGLGDSFVFSTTSPWATVSLASTFSDGLQILGQMTGPSCCGADPETTRIGIDIENAVFSILGRLGYRIGALQNQHYALVSDAQGGYSSEGGSDETVNLQLLQSIGMLSPVSLANGFDVPGGFRSTAKWEDWNASYDGGYRTRPFAETLNIFERVGLQAREVADLYSGTLEDGGNSRPVDQILEEQLARLSLKILPMQKGEQMVAPLADPRLTTAYNTSARLEASAEAMNRLQADAKAAGWKTSWSQPEDYEEGLPDCEHVVVDGEVVGGKAILPRDVVEVWRVGSGETAAWIARADCAAGATYGSLRAYAGYYAIDFSGPMPRSGRAFVSETGFLFENAIHHYWYENAFEIKANADFILSVFPGKGSIALIDRKARQFAWIGEGLPNGDLLLDAWLTDDRRHVIQLNTDGGFYVHSLERDARPLLTGRIVDDEIAVWTPDFHYDATAEAASLIDLKFPGHPAQYSLDRFGPARRVSGLAHLVLQGTWTGDEKPAVFTPPPNLSGNITLSRDLTGEAAGLITARLNFDTTEVARIAVYQDGQLSHSITGNELADTIEFKRLKDARWISLVAYTQDGLSSLPVSEDLGPVKAGRAVSRLLAIGINTYSDPALPSLNYALRDAGQIIAALTATDLSHQPFELVEGPKDRAATPSAILAAAKKLTEGLERGDHAVVFLAGHGLRDTDGSFYVATSQTDPARLDETALSFEKLQAVLKGTPASVTLLLDACHSGAAGGSSSASNDDLANGFSEAGSNVTVVAAAKGRQLSIGRRETGGLFTNALVNVIGQERHKHDRDGNGRIEASELYRGVKAKVVEATGGSQTPWITKSRVVGDYAIF